MPRTKRRSRQVSSYSLLLLIASTIVIFLLSGGYFYQQIQPLLQPNKSQAVRNIPGDLWADLQVGKRDFAEVSAREIVPYKLNIPGGVTVDTSTDPGRMYVWDAGNNRILGVNLATCYQSSTACSADIVIGQPSGADYGACNRDASFQNFPYKTPARKDTLCGIPEGTHTTLEAKSAVSMAVDASGNLYVPDFFNHRILKINTPFSSDTIADDVIGQNDYTSNYCNKTVTKFKDPAAKPTNSSLCFASIGGDGAAVVFDAVGNMWVADGGNNRVLRFPKIDNAIAKTADLVFGQLDFVSGGDYSGGDAMNRMHSPSSLAFDAQGNLFVADIGNQRVLKFAQPFVSGMSAQTVFGQFNELANIQAINNGMQLLTNENRGYENYARVWNLDGTVSTTLPSLSNRSLGMLGVDSEGSILKSTYVYGQDVHRFTKNADGTYSKTKDLFSPPYGYNKVSVNRFENGAWVGVTIANKQLIVADGRLLYWNDYGQLSNGKSPDGFIGTKDPSLLPNPAYANVSKDSMGNIYASRGGYIEIYRSPLMIGVAPYKTYTSFPVLGGGTIDFVWNELIGGLAATQDGQYLWVSQPDKHRVFRVRNPQTSPLVDIILGQKSVSAVQCNQGVYPPPQWKSDVTADTNMLCYPGKIAFDRKENLYVSDHIIETSGNLRMLMFAPSLFPNSPVSLVTAPFATKEFPRATSANAYAHATFEPAFDSTNRMVVGHNPYFHSRFPEFYNDPTKVNDANPRDPSYAIPDGNLKDFYGWPVAAVFDPEDNLYMYDANAGQVRMYKTPFVNLTPTPPPEFPIPTYTPVVTPTRIPTTTPTPTPATRDTVPPIVTITNPIANSVIPRRQSVIIQANATDEGGIQKVEFKAAGSLLCTVLSSPYKCTWKVPGKPGATFTIEVTGYDKANNSSTARVSITTQ